MADEKNEGQSLAEYAKTHGTGGSKFTIPKEPVTNDTLAAKIGRVPDINEGEGEWFRRGELLKESYREKDGKADRLPGMNEGEGEWFRRQEEKREIIKELLKKDGPEEPAPAGTGKFLSNLSLTAIANVIDDVKRNVEGVIGLGQQLEGEAKSIDEKAKNVARYKKDSFTP